MVLLKSRILIIDQQAIQSDLVHPDEYFLHRHVLLLFLHHLNEYQQLVHHIRNGLNLDEYACCYYRYSGRFHLALDLPTSKRISFQISMTTDEEM